MEYEDLETLNRIGLFLPYVSDLPKKLRKLKRKAKHSRSGQAGTNFTKGELVDLIAAGKERLSVLKPGCEQAERTRFVLMLLEDYEG